MRRGRAGESGCSRMYLTRFVAARSFPVPIAMVPVDRRAPADCEEPLLSNLEKKAGSNSPVSEIKGFETCPFPGCAHSSGRRTSREGGSALDVAGLFADRRLRSNSSRASRSFRKGESQALGSEGLI